MQLGPEGERVWARMRWALAKRPITWATLGVACVAAIVLGAALSLGDGGGVVVQRGSAARGSGETAAATPSEAPAEVVVDIDGAVERPGVFRLEEGSRVSDAIEAAGGLAADADISSVNRATVLIDGQKVHIPREGEAGDRAEPAPSPGSSNAAASEAAPAGSAGLVNLNTADAAALDGLPGIGPAIAAALIEDREANGPFASVDDLLRVSGIGEKKLERLRGSACV